MAEFKQLDKAWDKISERVEEWADHGLDMLPNFLVAIMVFILFIFFSRLMGRLLTKRLHLVSKNEAMNGMLVSTAKIAIMAFGLLTCLGILHLDKTVATLLAGIGIVGLAFSFAFQHTAHNLLSGIIIVSKSTINVGHMVEINGVTGVVTRIGLRATYVNNTEGQIVGIPNRLVTDENYTDYSVMAERRIDLQGHVHYDSDLELVEKVTIDAVKNLEGIKADNPIQFYFEDMSDFSVQYVIRFWIPFTNVHPEYLNAKHKAIKSIMTAYREKGIKIPYPITEIKGIQKAN